MSMSVHTLETVSQGTSDLGYHVRIFDMRLGTQRTQWISYLGDLRNLKTWRTLGTEEPWGPGDLGDRISWCSYCRGHGLRTPHEGINQRNLKIWADVADKICFHRNYKFGIGIWFSAVQWKRFPQRASVVRDQMCCKFGNIFKPKDSQFINFKVFPFKNVENSNLYTWNYCIKTFFGRF